MLQSKTRLIAWILATGCGVSFAAGAEADDVVIKHFNRGDATAAVGIADPSEDVELYGPQALTSDGSGNLFILDQLNQRVVRFDPKRPADDASVLLMPKEVQPRDLLVRKDEILIWDGSIRTFKASHDDQTRGVDVQPVMLEEVSTRGADDMFATSAFAQMGSRQPDSPVDLLDENTRAVATKKGRERSRQYVASRGKGSVVADVTPEKDDSSVLIEVRKAEGNETLVQLHMRVRDKLGTVEFLEIDYKDRLYVLAENIPASASGAATFVARYAPDGKLEGVYELPVSNTPLTRRSVTISGDGDVYFLRTDRTGINVIGVGFRPLRNVKAIDVRTAAVPDASGMGSFSAIAAVRPSNRQQVIETAFAFEGLQWTVTPANYGRDPDSACSGFNRIRRPWYLQNKVGQQVRGVPYCWGCHGSLAQFMARIEHGTMAGNVCTHDNPRPDVAGVDCSAFVSASWGLAVHYTTAAIPAIAKPVDNPWDLRPGDALNKPGSHVMLFLRFTPDKKAEVMESSTGGCNGRVCRNIYPLASLLARGYRPVRFRGLADDTTAVAQNAYFDAKATSPAPQPVQKQKHQTAKRAQSTSR